MHENISSPAKEKTKQNIETHDFSTPTEWNVEMVDDKVIVTLRGEDTFYFGRKNCLKGGVGLFSRSWRRVLNTINDMFHFHKQMIG